MRGAAVSEVELDALQTELRRFAEERRWGGFHTPKNLVMALAGEVGELLELFQWLTPEESEAVLAGPRADEVRDELADVTLYLVRLADILGVDLLAAASAKLDRNRERFPAPLQPGTGHRSASDEAPETSSREGAPGPIGSGGVSPPLGSDQREV